MTRRFSTVQPSHVNEAAPADGSLVFPGAPVSEQLWRDVHERLTAFVAQRVDEPADVADLVQTVFLRVHRNAASVVEEDRLLPWLFQITRNAIADYYRAPARRREIAEVAPDGGPRFTKAGVNSDAAASTPGPSGDFVDEDATALAELANCVRPMMQQLPTKYRDALALVEFEGLSQVKVASQLGISVSGMKSRVQRGRTMLRDVLLVCCEISQSATGGVLDFARRPESNCSGAGCGSAPDTPPEPVVSLLR